MRRLQRRWRDLHRRDCDAERTRIQELELGHREGLYSCRADACVRTSPFPPRTVFIYMGFLILVGRNARADRTAMRASCAAATRRSRVRSGRVSQSLTAAGSYFIIL